MRGRAYCCEHGPAERTALERDLAGSAELEAQIDLQRAIDEVLRRRYVLPSEPELRAVAERAVEASMPEPPPARIATGTWRRWAIAATVLFSGAGVWLMWRSWGALQADPDPYLARTGRISLAELYRGTVAAGFEPEIVCRDEPTFRRWFDERLGQPLTLGTLPADTRAMGLGYTNVLSPWSIYVLVRSGESEIVLVVDRVENDWGMPWPEGSGLHAHRTEVERLVAYEVSPLRAPILLDGLANPEEE
jgi:hypothetical protein